MALFPAYGHGEQIEYDHEDLKSADGSSSEAEDIGLSPRAEAALLCEPGPAAARAPPAAASADFYLDCKLDTGNLRVSTLYYPARPEYLALGAALGGGRGARRERARRAAARYWRRPAEPAAAAPDAAARSAALRLALQQAPQDLNLWLQYADFLEWCESSGPQAAASAAHAAAAGAAELPDAAELRARMHAALRRALPPDELAMRLSALRAEEKRADVRAELWAREMSALACAGRLAGAERALRAALRDRTLLRHAPLLTYTLGAALRSAGLWERLVQLVELLCAMNFPRSDTFPPPRSDEREEAAERQLAEFEERAARSGLPRACVWSRVERARAALHWRAPRHATPLQLAADPQRAPSPAAAADLLAPVADARCAFRLLVALLRLAEAPLLPAAGYVARGVAGGAGAAELAADWDAAALAGLLRAARRLPRAHPAAAAASPAVARRLLALAPLRAAPLSDSTGFAAWSGALWTAALQWTEGPRRVALLCWRLRVLHARLLLLDAGEGSAGARRLRGEARELLRGAGQERGAQAAWAVFARLEAAAAGAARGRQAALQAARAALREGGPAPLALYAARVHAELAADAAQAQWGLACAALGRAPPRPLPDHPPPPDMLRDALRECENRCEELERKYEEAEMAGEGEGGEEEPSAALLPGAGEWGCARALLAGPARRRELLRRLLAAGGGGARTAAAARYREQCACALAAAASQEHAAAAVARQLLHLAPLNGYLALLSGGAAVWERGEAATAAGRLRALAAPRTETAALAALLPALARAAAADWAPAEAAAAERACARAERAAGAAGGAQLQLARLQAAAAHSPRAARAALERALHLVPHCKALAERGAALGVQDAAELAELCMERGLRLHALPAELHEPPSEPHGPPTEPHEPPTEPHEAQTEPREPPTEPARYHQ